MRLDDPDLVAAEYADDARLRRRAAAYTGVEFGDRAAVEEYVRASISMSPFVANLPTAIKEPFRARRANSISVAEKAAA